MFAWIALAFFGMVLIGMPIAFALGITGLIGLMLTMGTSLLMLVPQQIFSGMNSFVLMAIPLFLLSGELMNVSGITERIVAFTNTLVGHRKGGLGHVNIVANIFMAGISGAAVADAAALGTMLIPAMGKSGYSRPYSSALTAAASIIGPTIPPSMAMIVYGSVANTSIAGLFATGFLPGLLMGILYMILNHRISSKRGYQMQAEKASRAEVFKAMKDGIFALFMPVIILGGLTSVPGAIIGGLIIGVGEKLSEVYIGPLVGGGIEIWFAYVLALVFLLFRPQGLFGEKIIDRV